VDDKRLTYFVAIAGAVIGGTVAYCLFTEQGRSALRKIQPSLDSVAEDVDRLRKSAMKTFSTAWDVWAQFGHLLESGAATKATTEFRRRSAV